MPNLKNEFPKRIIRVSGCHECPEVESKATGVLGQGVGTCWLYSCRLEGFNVNKYISNETLSDNCPLEKEKHIIMEGKE